VFAVVAIMGIFLDRITKSLAVIHLSDGHAHPFIPGVLDFSLIYNTGAAWGMLDGARTFFLIVMAVALLGILIYLAYFKRHTALQIIGLGLIAAGAIGNGIDRAMTGKVVDFLHTLFIVFPSFNIADSCITVGVILFIVALLFGEPEQMGKAQLQGEGAGTASADAVVGGAVAGGDEVVDVGSSAIGVDLEPAAGAGGAIETSSGTDDA
jgi:signal peptidase II